MTELVFVDTSGWFAATVPWDVNHDAAAEWLGQNGRTLVTTDFVVDEVLTLFKARGEMVRAVTFGENLFSGRLATLCRLSDDDFIESWQLFQSYQDKLWSFTDCTSKVVMERLGVTTAFAFDRHFHQFGTVAVVP